MNLSIMALGERSKGRSKGHDIEGPFKIHKWPEPQRRRALSLNLCWKSLSGCWDPRGHPGHLQAITTSEQNEDVNDSREIICTRRSQRYKAQETNEEEQGF